jgi:hypothetical protein
MLGWILLINVIEYIIKAKEDYDETCKFNWKKLVNNQAIEEDDFTKDWELFEANSF